MNTVDYEMMSDAQLVELLTKVVGRTDNELVRLMGEVIGRLAARHECKILTVCEERTPTGRRISPTTIFIDSERFRDFLYRNRLRPSDLGEMIGRSRGWGHMVTFKGKIGSAVLDELATALGTHVDVLIAEFATESEKERLIGV